MIAVAVLAGDDAEKTGVVVVLRTDQLIETVGAVGRSVAMDFDGEAACGGKLPVVVSKFHAEDGGRFVATER
jgi:hypothetical protein